MRVQRLPWRSGPEAPGGEVVVSVTDFRVDRALDQVAVWAQGVRLRRAWRRMDGAVGLWVWAEPGARRSGSISVWRSEEDLRRFVGWDVHVAIMKAWRDRGTLLASTWRTTAAAPDALWSEGRRRVRAVRAEAAA